MGLAAENLVMSATCSLHAQWHQDVASDGVNRISGIQSSVPETNFLSTMYNNQLCYLVEINHHHQKTLQA